MNNDWTTQRGQLDQALDRERALRQAWPAIHQQGCNQKEQKRMTGQKRSLECYRRRLHFIVPISWSLLSSLVLLWFLVFNPGHSLAQVSTIPAWMNPLQSSGALQPQDYPNLCLQMNKIPDFDGGVINLWTCDGSNSQIWVLYADNTLRPADYPTFCMNLPEELVTNSEAPNAVPCDGSNGQKWSGDDNHNLHLQG